MTKILIPVLAALMLTLSTRAATLDENKALISSITNPVEAVSFFYSLPAEEQLADVFMTALRKYDPKDVVEAQAILDTVAASAWPSNKYIIVIGSNLTLGNTNAVISMAAAVLSNPPAVREYSKIRDYRSFVLTAAFKKNQPVFGYTDAQIANYTATALLYPTGSLTKQLKQLVNVWVKVGSQCTTHTVQEVFNSLEYTYKPVITTQEDALWWGVNVTSKAN